MLTAWTLGEGAFEHYKCINMYKCVCIMNPLIRLIRQEKYFSALHEV